MISINSWDIVSITETWINTRDRDYIGEYSIEGYSIFHKDRLHKVGGGILIYIKEGLNPTEIKLNNNHELICIELNLNIVVRLVLVYRPPNQTAEIDRNLYHTLGEIIENKTSIIVGDFNSPSINWESLCSNNEDSKLLDFYSDHFLTQFVDKPTRGQNILDLILATEEEIITDVNVGCPLAAGDHGIVRYNMEIGGNKDYSTISRLNYRAAKWSL